jgi:5-carboxymethyl-2-hydroxymuconate isomerase
MMLKRRSKNAVDAYEGECVRSHYGHWTISLYKKDGRRGRQLANAAAVIDRELFERQLRVGGLHVDNWQLAQLDNDGLFHFRLWLKDGRDSVRAEGKKLVTVLKESYPTEISTGAKVSWSWRISDYVPD